MGNTISQHEPMTFVGFVLLFIFLSLIVLFVIVMLQPLFTHAAYVSTNKKILSHILSELDIKQGESLIDLGSGDGRLLRVAAEEYGVYATGYEVGLLPLISSRMKNWFFFLKKPNLRQLVILETKSAFDANISQADAIYCYMSTDFNNRINEKLLTETKEGVHIATLAFPLQGFTVLKHGTIQGKEYWIYEHTR